MAAVWIIGLTLCGIVAGASLNNCIAMAPALRRLDIQTRASVGRAWSRRPARAFAVAAGIAAVAGVVLIALDDHAAGAPLPTATVLTGLTAVGLALADRVDTARRRTAGAPDWRRWYVMQASIACASVAATACYAIAAGSS